MKGRRALGAVLRDMRFHLLLTAAFSAQLIPLVQLLCTSCGTGIAAAVFFAGLPLLLACLGMTMTIGLRRMLTRKPRRFRLLLWGITLLLAVLPLVLRPFPSAFLSLLYGICAGGSFYGGSRLCHVPLEAMTTPYVCTGLFLWNLFVWLASRLLHVQISAVPMVLVLCGTMLLFSVLRNRLALETVLHDRDGELWELPKEISRSNNGALAVLWGIGLLLMCCTPWLGKLLRRLWQLLRDGFLRLLVALMSGGSQVPEESSMESLPVEAVPQQESAAPSWIVPLLACILLVSLAVVVWKNRREIVDGVLRLWHSLCRFLREKLNRPVDLQEPGGAYCDYVEDLLTMETGARENQSRKRKTWWKRYRKYLRMPRDGARFRVGYGLALERLPEEVCAPADSVAEILQKLAERESAEMTAWEKASRGYDRVRYGEQKPTEEEFQALEQILHRTRQ